MLAVCALTVLCAALAHVPSLLQPIDRDMAAHATIGALAAEGWLPYRDVVDNKQPLPYLVYAAAHLVAPHSTLALRTAATAIVATAGLSVLLLTRRDIGLAAATAAAVLVVLVGSSRWVQGVDLNTEHLLVLTGTWAVLVPLRWRERARVPLAAGVLLALAALTKAPGVLLAVPALVLLVAARHQRKESAAATVGLYAVGALLPVAAVVGFYALHGAVGELLYWNLTYNLGYVGAAPEAAAPLFNVELWPVLLLALAGLVGALLVLLAPGDPRRRALAAAVGAWLGAAFVGAKVGGREFPHYYAPLVVPAALGVGLGLSRLGWPRDARRGMIGGLTAVAVVVALAAPAVLDVASQYGQSPDELAVRLYRSPQADPWTYQEEAGAWLRDRAGPTDRLFVVGNEPGFYWASGVAPATPYLLDLHIAVRADFWDELAGRLDAEPPRWLVFPRGEPVWHPYVQPLETRGYVPVAVFGPVHILELAAPA